LVIHCPAPDKHIPKPNTNWGGPRGAQPGKRVALPPAGEAGAGEYTLRRRPSGPGPSKTFFSLALDWSSQVIDRGRAPRRSGRAPALVQDLVCLFPMWPFQPLNRVYSSGRRVRTWVGSKCDGEGGASMNGVSAFAKANATLAPAAPSASAA